MIECERIVVYSFNSPHKVASFLATQLPPEFQQILEENKRNMYRGGTIEPGGMLGTTWKKVSISSRTVRRISGDTPATGDVNQKQIAKKMHSQGLDAKIAKAIEKAEQRKKRRLARQAEWDELYRTKPDDQYADPNDVAAIKEAQENIGDFKLKTAKDYVVPESQRVNAEKKRVQLLQLQELVHQYKWQFNQRLLALRDKKIEVVSEVKKLCTELEQLQSRLPSSIHTTIPSAPVLDPEELPEKAYEYTKETLLAFKKDMDSKLTSDQKDGNGGAGGFGGFAGFGGGGESHQPATKPASQIASTKTGTEQRGRSTSVLSTLSSQPRSASSIPVDRGTPEIITEEQYLDEEPSDMEKKIQEENKIRLTYERDVLLKKIKELLSNFDAELRVLRHEKIHLEVDLKNADLRLITLFEELVLLKEFEKRENVLMGKVETKMQEKEDMQEKVEECQLKLEAKKEEIDKLQEKDKALYSTFSHTLGENNKFEGFLTKVFKKKIKRVKKTEKDAGSDEESEEDESDEDYDSDEEENSDAEELDDSVCPPGCDQAIFDQVCQLRENRLDLEEAAAEEKKAADALKKELDGLIKKVKIIDSALKTAEADLEAFQREKQQKLNELDVVVTLKLNQLQYVINSSIPQDLAQCLIFTSSGLEKLQRRIKELEKEKAEQKKLYRERRQQHVQLIRDKKVMDAKIIELEEKVKQTQLLKFGRLIDLEKLETVSVNRVAEELKEKLRLQEFESAKEIAEWEKKIDAYKAKLTQVTRENTQRLDTYTVLLQEKKELEHQLDSRQKNLGGEFQGNRKADFQERQRLIQLIQLQGQEIEALKEEITMLSRKGGHIIPPSQPPQTSGHSLGPSV